MAENASRSSHAKGYHEETFAANTPYSATKYQCNTCPWDTFVRAEMDAHVQWHEAGSPPIPTA